MGFGLALEHTTQWYSQKLLALASPLHMFFLLSWSGVVPITATQPLSKSTKTPSMSQKTFRLAEEEQALRRLESPPRANDGLIDIPGTGGALSLPKYHVLAHVHRTDSTAASSASVHTRYLFYEKRVFISLAGVFCTGRLFQFAPREEANIAAEPTLATANGEIVLGNRNQSFLRLNRLFGCYRRRDP